MSKYNLQTFANKLTLQPFLDFKRSGTIVLLLALAIALAGVIVPRYFPEQSTLKPLFYVVAGMFALRGLFEYVIKSNIVIEFDKEDGFVFKKLPGLYKRRLIKIEDIESIVPIYTNGTAQYCITNRHNMFGKNYPVSSFVSDKSKRKREFEEIVLPAIYQFIGE